jgi:hypothetical protein
VTSLKTENTKFIFINSFQKVKTVFVFAKGVFKDLKTETENDLTFGDCTTEMV